MPDKFKRQGRTFRLTWAFPTVYEDTRSLGNQILNAFVDLVIAAILAIGGTRTISACVYACRWSFNLRSLFPATGLVATIIWLNMPYYRRVGLLTGSFWQCVEAVVLISIAALW